MQYQALVLITNIGLINASPLHGCEIGFPPNLGKSASNVRVRYRHVVLTVPEQFRKYFYHNPLLLSELMKTGHAFFKDVISFWLKEAVDVGSAVVLQSGRLTKWKGYDPETKRSSFSCEKECLRECPLNPFPKECPHRKNKHGLSTKMSIKGHHRLILR